MTMVPARNLLPQHYASSYGGCLAGRRRGADAAGATTPSSTSDKFMLIRSSSPSSDPFLFVDHMAEDESRTSSFNDAAAGSSRHARQQQGEKDADDDEEEDKDNNKSNEERDVGWLQLGLGSHAGGSGHQQARTADQRPGLIELDLFTDGRHRASASTAPAFHVSDFAAARRATYGASASVIAPTLPIYHPHHARTSLSIGQQPEMTWGYRHGPWDPTAAASSSSSLPLFYASRPFQHPFMPAAFTSSAAAADVGPSSSARIIDPPPSRRRPGLWFVLQASHNQGKEPFLPQIPKSYLRIKDGGMTVRLLMKYVSNKLGLNNESEVEISCKGQQLPPTLTLQHVRDSMWSTRDAGTVLPDTPTADHVMILHYARSA